jgi:hypothetical protein
MLLLPETHEPFGNVDLWEACTAHFQSGFILGFLDISIITQLQAYTAIPPYPIPHLNIRAIQTFNSYAPYACIQ